MKNIKYASILLLGLFILGCSKPTMVKLTDEKYAKKRKYDEIDLYVGKFEGYHKQIAIISSNSLPTKDEFAKEEQIEYLKKQARKLGADAIHEIRLLPREVRGFIQDENVPFKAWKQGVHYLYFLRGTAIRYTEPDENDPYSFEEDFKNL